MRYVIFIIVITGILAPLNHSVGKLRVVFLDVGQGDSILIETPSRKIILVDGGPDDTLIDQLAVHMPYLKRKIDYMILTHPDADHVTGLVEVFEYYDVGAILFTGVDHRSRTYQEFLRRIEAHSVKKIFATPGAFQPIDDFVTLETLFPRDDIIPEKIDHQNRYSVVTRLNFHKWSILLTGDIEKESELNLVQSYNQNLQSDILKVAHHGSRTSSDQSFLGLVQPDFAFIQVGRNNPFGHPHDEVVQRLFENKIDVFRTDVMGALEVRFFLDGTMEVHGDGIL